MKQRIATTVLNLAGLLIITVLLMQFVPGGPVESLIAWAEEFGRPLPPGPIR